MFFPYLDSNIVLRYALFYCALGFHRNQVLDLGIAIVILAPLEQNLREKELAKVLAFPFSMTRLLVVAFLYF